MGLYRGHFELNEAPIASGGGVAPLPEICALSIFKSMSGIHGLGGALGRVAPLPVLLGRDKP